MSECCRKTFLFLAYVVSTVGSIAYCFYLVWLLAYLKDNGYYWFFAFIPALLFIPLIFGVILKDRDVFFFPLFGVVLLVMCSFTILTRQAYYHLSADVLIGPEWVIMSLEGSIVFFVSAFLIDKECRLQSILEAKDILSRGLLDFVDIFNLVQLLSLNQCVGIGSSVAEGSSLEMAIQAFCTMSLVILFYIYGISYLVNSTVNYPLCPLISQDDSLESTAIYFVYLISVLFQNIPFLVIRIIVWANYNVFSLGFMVKNILAIVVCCAEIYQKIFVEDDVEQNEENHSRKSSSHLV